VTGVINRGTGRHLGVEVCRHEDAARKIYGLNSGIQEVLL
jgi:hypothetical protein